MSLDKPLGLLLVDAQQWITQYVQQRLQQQGYVLNHSEFSFLANLDCGETHASSVARRMGISRQAVYRTTKDLSARGLLELIDDPEKRNQKIISMTQDGMAFVNAARAALCDAENALAERIGSDRLRDLKDALSMDWGAVD